MSYDGKMSSKTIVLTGYGGYDKLKIEYRPIPRPGQGQVVVQVKASGINFAELMCRQGTYDRTPKVPAVLGMEACGVVHDVGPGVSTLKKGQRIVCMDDMGLWTEYAAVAADQCFPIPDSMTFEQGGALLVNYVTAYQMLFDFGNLRPGKSVLVHMAAGGVGMAATQLCQTVPNVTVFGTASASKHELIRKNGVTHPIDYRTKDYVEEVRKVSPKGVDIVLDPLNGADAVKGYNLLKKLGKIIHYGAANAVSGPNRSLWSIATTYMSVRSYNPLFMLGDNRSACGYHLGHMFADTEVYTPVVQELIRLFEAGKIKPVVDTVWSFEEVGKAMSRMHDRLNVGKVVITPNKPENDEHSTV
jgi:NADPH:quinone reductase-like Zn-dependent oxidoreductase